MLNSKDSALIKQACDLGETLGYFEVYSVTDHRAAIEWSLLFPYEELQPFLDTCTELGIDTDKSASVFCVDVVTAVYASFSDIVLL